MENNAMKTFLLLLSCMMLAVGACGGPLISRLYFIHGGSRLWLSSCLQTGGFPIILIPLVVAYMHRRKTTGSGNTELIVMKHILFLVVAGLGILSGLGNYLVAFGTSKLPVSTYSLINASQLVFIAVFAFLLVKQKFTPYSINAVVLLTVGSVLLALHTSSDRPEGESNKEYVLGFVMTLAAAALVGLLLPLLELTYAKARQPITFSLLLEIQIVLCFVATVLCTVGMLINNDFQSIVAESREFELGEMKYYLVLVFTAIVWQFSMLGAIGVIFCTSSLFCGIEIAILLPVTEILAVIFYHEKFQAEKIVALILSLWGFASYFLGEIKQNKKTNRNPNAEASSQQGTPLSEVSQLRTPQLEIKALVAPRKN